MILAVKFTREGTLSRTAFKSMLTMLGLMDYSQSTTWEILLNGTATMVRYISTSPSYHTMSPKKTLPTLATLDSK